MAPSPIIFIDSFFGCSEWILQLFWYFWRHSLVKSLSHSELGREDLAVGEEATCRGDSHLHFWCQEMRHYHRPYSTYHGGTWHSLASWCVRTEWLALTFNLISCLSPLLQHISEVALWPSCFFSSISVPSTLSSMWAPHLLHSLLQPAWGQVWYRPFSLHHWSFHSLVLSTCPVSLSPIHKASISLLDIFAQVP